MYSVVLTGVPRTYPASAFNRFSAYISSIRAQLALWFRSYSESLFPNAEKVTKKACPWRTAFAPVPLRGHAATGHPWPIAALPASMPVDPLRRTSSRPPDGAGRSKSKANSKSDPKQIQSRSKADPKQIQSRLKTGALVAQLFCPGLGIEPECSYLLREAMATGPRLTPTVC